MIRDLLWACVICGEVEALRLLDRVETCTACGARYRRVHGAQIEIEMAGRGIETRSAAEWSGLLPAVTMEGHAECLVRVAERDLPVRGYGEYLGRVERFGEFHFGELSLNDARLRFIPRAAGVAFDWHLSQLTAVQPTSTALQIKARGQPVAAIKFVNSSPRLWEERLQLALRHHYSGRDIIEFQPRICVR